MVERESDLDPDLRIVNLLTPSILRALGCDLNQPKKESILWQKFSKLNTIFKVGNESYGLNLTQVPPAVIDFLRRLVEARMAASRNKEQGKENKVKKIGLSIWKKQKNWVMIFLTNP